MSTVALIFNENKINKKGEVPLWLRITKDRKSKYIAIGVRLKKEHWDEDKMKVRKGHPNCQRLNNFIAQKIADAEGVALDMETSKKYSNVKKVKDAITGRSSESFIKYADNYLKKAAETNKYGTIKKSTSIIKKLKDYLDQKDMTFDEFDIDFIKQYETHLRAEKNCTNTINNNLKEFRKLFNLAVSEGVVKIDKNPFIGYKLHTEKTEKNFLTDKELEAIENVKLEPHHKINHHRNLYVFAAYTGGIRISDLFQLKWKNYDGERIVIRTKKTNDILSIKVPDKAKAILNFYDVEDSEPEHFIFPFLKNDVDYSDPAVLHQAISSATAYTNKDLDILAKRLKINKHVHFHTSRHTFATRALRKGMRIEYVSKLMSHTNLRTTQVYAKIVNEELDKAMDIFNE
jgi:integrase/recombinase XerD